MYTRRDKAEIKESPRKGNESLESLLRNMGNEPFRASHDKLCYYWPEANFAGWPLQLGSPTLTMTKCDKCAREKRNQEYFSTFNCRRHVRGHRKTPDKNELSKSREDIAEFWNQLPQDQALKILTLAESDVDVLTGTDTGKALTSFVQQVTLSYHSQQYFRAGVALDSMQKGIKRGTPLADELFKVLDEASEKTFLTTGTCASVVRFIGEIPKVFEDERNSIALAAFLVEDNLVKAWNADKDEKALRVQEALVEEEEAAQKKREKHLEKKRLKKLRQKERKGPAVELTVEDLGVSGLETAEGVIEDLETAEAAEAVNAAEAAEVPGAETVEVTEPVETAVSAQGTGLSESFDHVDADMFVPMETRLIWADEVSDVGLAKELPAKLPEKKPFSSVNGVKEQGIFSKRQRPNFQRPSKASSNTVTNGYSVWSRKDKLGSVRDASTDIVNQEEEEEEEEAVDDKRDEPKDHLDSTLEKPNDARAESPEEQQTNVMMAEVTCTVEEPASSEAQVNDADAGLVKPLEDATELTEDSVVVVSDGVEAETEGLLIGSLSIPWAVTPIERRKGPNVVDDDDEQKQHVELQVETQILLDSPELAAWKATFLRILSERWAAALADVEVKFATTEAEASPSQEDVAEVGSVGVSEATPSGNVVAETDEKRVEVRNGGYRKGRWASKDKASEQRYFPKKQAPA